MNRSQELPQAFTRDRVAVITGAASGIGLATARRVAALGMKVMLADLGGDALDRAAAALGSAPALAVPTDVSRESDLTAWRTKVSAHFGPVSVLMNNAGVGQNPRKPRGGRGRLEVPRRCQSLGRHSWCAGVRPRRASA